MSPFANNLKAVAGPAENSWYTKSLIIIQRIARAPQYNPGAGEQPNISEPGAGG